MVNYIATGSMIVYTYISLSCVMTVHGGKSLQAKGVTNENSYEQPCRPINSGWAFCGKKNKNLNPISKRKYCMIDVKYLKSMKTRRKINACKICVCK